MSNKDIIIRFTNEVFNKKDLTLVDSFIHEDYRQHNPTVAQGREGFIEFATGFFARFPNLHLHIKHIYEDGDVVVSHNHAVLKPGEVENIVFDVYRLRDGKLAEHWDCIQRLTPEQIARADELF
ncbi:MAG: SnoaL-like domain-containing protein [Clostridiaceae bacterium]|nr:SnoaL-like domain-containing protein [Clostridiaceae bacterium]